MKENRYSQ